MLDALGEGQVALESAVQGLTVIWRLCSNCPCHLQRELVVTRLYVQDGLMYNELEGHHCAS